MYFFFLGGGEKLKNTFITQLFLFKIYELKKGLRMEKKNVQDSLIKVKQTTIYKLFSRDIDTRINFQNLSVLQ